MQLILFGRTRFWRWSDDREEYEIVYHNQEEWQVNRRFSDTRVALKANKKIIIFMQAFFSAKDGDIEATFSVPFRPQLFGKAKPVVLNLSRVALARDEVFLMLVFIYNETKRQEKMVRSRSFCLGSILRTHDHYSE
jgi:hypothetical protein